ncbi:hypothetical protein JCM33374_g1265 [Metschnikowia sp. JCM 33374]|nr:hypothetical protein JCM33374_g1265 [Metschnikowia sp. JCM 33374]
MTRNACSQSRKYMITPSRDLGSKRTICPAKTLDAPLFVCHHGAGSSAMTFWCLAQYLRKFGNKDEPPGVFAFDARGHGDTDPKTTTKYALSDFTGDFCFVLKEFLARNRPQNPICLMGHSLGGAVLTDFVENHVDTQQDTHVSSNIKGLVVIDIVEETAIQSLTSIAMFLNKRPKSFSSYNSAVQWHLQSRLLRNEESARVSVPDLLTLGKAGPLTWKASLPDMSGSWDTWFLGLSSKFLDCNFEKNKLAKLLILSSNETLDKDLTIGQMQGKFQLIVFNNSTNAGHFLHEDIPHQVAACLMDFMRRFNASSQRNQQKSITSLWGGKINT